MEKPPREIEHDRGLNGPDYDVSVELAYERVDRVDRCREQRLPTPPLAFANQSESTKHEHADHHDDSGQSRHDRPRSPAFGIVEPFDIRRRNRTDCIQLSYLSPIRILERGQSWTHPRWIYFVDDDPGLARQDIAVGIGCRYFDPDTGLSFDDHSFGDAWPKPVSNDHEVPGPFDGGAELLGLTIIVARDSNRHLLGIEINRIAEEHDLDRRNQQDQRNSRRIPHEVQYLYMGHSQHPSEA